MDPWSHGDAADLSPELLAALNPDNVELSALRRTYSELDWPACVHSRWSEDQVRRGIELRNFRGESLIIRHYRHGGGEARYRYFLYLNYVQELDQHGLVSHFEEDGAFGCLTYHFEGRPTCSRDSLDSANELLFLHRQIGLLGLDGLRVIDIGAGYGRLAHRFAQAVPGLSDYCCVDAVAESTYLSDLYLRYREVSPPARVVPLTGVIELDPGSFDLAVNVHSFSECTLDAIDWWLGQLERLQVPFLFLVPNESTGFLSTEQDGSRRDFLPCLHRHGFRLLVDEPVIADPDMRYLTGISDRFCLLRGGASPSGLWAEPKATVADTTDQSVGRVALALAFDRNYLPYAATTILSAIDQHQHTGVDLDLLHDGSVGSEEQHRLEESFRGRGDFTLRWRTVPLSEVADLPTTAHFGSIVWLRFLLPYLLSDRKRCLYVDSDVLVKSPLHDLMGMDLGGYPIGAVANVLEPSMRGRVASLGIRYPGGYFNSGVLLMDLEAMRAEDSPTQLMRFARDHRDQILWPDQDALNGVFRNRWRWLHPQWNAQSGFWVWDHWAQEIFTASELAEAKYLTKVRHFEGPAVVKPWHYLYPLDDRASYLDKLARTPWSDEAFPVDRTVATRLIRRAPHELRIPLYKWLRSVRTTVSPGRQRQG